MGNYRKLIGIVFFEKFAFNGLRSILILYAIKFLAMNKHDALECIGAALGVGFLAPTLGGFLATWIRNPKVVILFGLCLTVFSTVLLFIYHGNSNQMFYLSLTLLMLGTGFVRANVPALLSYYLQGNPSLFTQYYVYINMGSLLGTFSCGLLSEVYGWQLGFIFSFLASSIALILASQIQNIQIDTVSKNTKTSYLKSVTSIIFALPITYLSITHIKVFGVLNVVVLVSVLFYLFDLVYRRKLLSTYHFYTFIILAVTHTIFLALYDQGSYSLTLFTESYVDRQIPQFLQPCNLMNWELLPVSGFQLIDPAFNILFGSLIVTVWKALEHNGKSISIYTKFIVGISILALAFALLYNVIDDSTNQINLSNIFILYVLFVLSELCIIPNAMTFVGRIAPSAKKPLFMGFWFTGMGIAQWLALNLAKIATTPNSDQTCVNIINYKHCFLMFAYIALGVMVALVAAKLIDSIYFKKVAKRSD